MIRLVLAIALVIPLGLDLYMPVPEDNPMTAEKIELGRRLFNDRRLSRDGSTACVTCHDPARAFSDGRALAVGVFGRVGRRHAPALINRGYGCFFINADIGKILVDPAGKPILGDKTAWAAADVDGDGFDDLIFLTPEGQLRALLNPKPGDHPKH